MIDDQEFIRQVRDYFAFLESEFGFVFTKEKIKGNFYYDIQYCNNNRLVSVSYENIEDYLLVIVFLTQSGELPDYDDQSKTLHLSKMTQCVFPQLSKGEIDANTLDFIDFYPKDEIGFKLLKAAKELRLCLRHFDFVLESVGRT